MYWYRPRQKLAQDIEAIVRLLNGSDGQQASAAMVAQQLPYNEKINDALFAKIRTRLSGNLINVSQETLMQSIVAIGKHLPFMPENRKEELLNVFVRAITQSATIQDKVQTPIIRLLPQFGDMISNKTQALRDHLDALGRNKSSEAKLVASELTKSMEAIGETKDTDDVHIIGSDPKQNAASWKKIQKKIGVGAKIKAKPFGQKTFAIGVVSEIKYVPYKVGTETFNVPILVITMSNKEKIEVNILAPKYDIWTYRDFEELSLSEYKGIWIETSDQAATSFMGAKPGSFVKGVLVGRDKGAVTIKLVKDNIPWIIEVPEASVRPTGESPTWGREYSKRKSPISAGDVVEMKSVPGEKYIVETADPSSVRLRPISAKPGAGFVEAKYDDVKYVGRYELGKGFVNDPHVRSPLLKKPQVPDAE